MHPCALWSLCDAAVEDDGGGINGNMTIAVPRDRIQALVNQETAMEQPASRPVRSIWFIVLSAAMILACADTPDYGSGSSGENTSLSISKSKAVVNEWYSAKLTVYSTYVETVEFSPNYEGNLPPGISFNSYSGEFSGTPTQTGVYSVKIYYRDPNKGTYAHPNLADNLWYVENVEIEVSRFQQPEYTSTISVTCTNNTTWTSTFYVDGSSVATLGPGDSTTISVRSGKRIVQHTDSDGSMSPEEVWNLEAGKNYEWTLKPR
jgi:hypothetical protein